MQTRTFNIKHLVRGLRPSEKAPRNSGFLLTCNGAIGDNGSLSSLESYTKLDTPGTFQYLQLFVFPKVIIICSATDIYEWVNSALVLKFSTTTGKTWRAEAFGEFVYLSNGKVAVERDAYSKAYSLSSQPVAGAICNFNGQVIIGSPGVVN